MTALTMQEAAERLGCKRSFLYAAAQRSEIPVVRFGRRVLVDEEDIPEIVRIYKVPARPREPQERT